MEAPPMEAIRTLRWFQTEPVGQDPMKPVHAEAAGCLGCSCRAGGQWFFAYSFYSLNLQRASEFGRLMGKLRGSLEGHPEVDAS